MPELNPFQADLFARFRPIFAQIAERAAQREQERELAFDAVALLREAGFGALRVPVALGGLGASVEQLFQLLIELGEADSNLPQILRAHFGFVERLYAEIAPELRERWLRLVARGAIFGNATTELGDGAPGKHKTNLSPDGEGWRLDGEKFYSTGTLYADWIAVSASREGSADPVYVLVPANAPGIDRIDDWRGFGQRLTGSGTTRFRDVAVSGEQVLSFPRNVPTSITAYFQLVHLATLAGIARAIERDAAAFVRARKRVYSHGSGRTPAEDPLVQQVVGQLAGTAFIAASAVAAVAQGLGEIDRLRQRGQAVPVGLLDDVELRTAKAQVGIADQVLAAATRLFDIGGASALDEDRRLDRHWRNARTLASHNPTLYKGRAVGDHVINGTAPTYYWSVGAKAA
ncbi:acyl-CoA dehydrogenase family protein [Cupriavidus basilensis]|uniref:Dibenzothiophene monooxygenase n=1 Tax=Cupriavidus basilensis TaxID=68895 RepID=A0A643FZD6_9BURK|nr:acyl-CoA dehydrogenase family protein [Cupriavidus basilensis]QOT81165.1 acyl-CoA dehydrogenase family protein [Cupriavidus basilensis]